ncbi:hypothetical protein GIB67_007420 [Kingdonia uniflora]|uniref:LYR motif-containing protein 2 n=1 Tax=Kingdonia uniflora TaxID=39325 RepID=A0A7J7MLK3_9MAGN|nr:hypothetical protein GIB67_007420 [Kingdonia uniflora]
MDYQRSSSELKEDMADDKKGKDKSSKKKKKNGATSESKHESEYKKGFRPVLWLTPDFPLQTEELLPLLDILANKVKATFILRARVLKLYRQALRVAHRAPTNVRGELRQTIRQENEKNQNCDDKQKIRFLISEGLERVKTLDEMLNMQGH